MPPTSTQRAGTTVVVAALLHFPLTVLAQGNPPDSGWTGLTPTHSLTLRPAWRRYRVGSTTSSEWAGDLTYTLNAGIFRGRLTSGALGFSSSGTSITGAPPIELRGDLRMSAQDTLQFTLRTASIPRVLDSSQVAAIGNVGTSMLDLASISLGTTAAAGARLAVARPIGSLIIGARAGIEIEPRPGGSDSVYWRGSTVRAGLSLTGFLGEFRITGNVDLTRSFSDSLGGRNLFPGGGSLILRAGAIGLLGETGSALADFAAFYFRPFGLTRPAQPNRLIPAGELAGLTGTFLIPAGAFVVTPVISLSREASSADLVSLGVLTRVNGSGWASSGSLGVEIPLAQDLSLTPEVGVVGGHVSTEFVVTRQNLAISGLRTPFSDPLSGWWTAIELSASF